MSDDESIAHPSPTPTRTPGVYVQELNAFPASVVGVETAVPAFVGYTETARLNGKEVRGKAVRVDNLAAFAAIFGGPCQPAYRIEAGDAEAYDVHVSDADGTAFYRLRRVPSPRFLLHASMALFFANGGGAAYVLSVGDYDAGMDADALSAGLATLADLDGPTLLVIPDAVSLPTRDAFTSVTQAMLAQAAALQDRVALLDVFGADAVTSASLDATVAAFRAGVVSEAPSYGVAYFPFLRTTVVDASGFDSRNFADPASASAPDIALRTVLDRAAAALYPADSAHSRAVGDAIATLTDATADPAQRDASDQRLRSTLPVYVDMLNVIADDAAVLPPSAAMAGVYSQVDGSRGVWNAPANVSLSAVVAPTCKLSDSQQADLNVPVDGKAINALREFVGRGTLVWGARTLDGNSNDYRYIQVRRTLIYIEQSIKAALAGYTFAANDARTWRAVVAMVSSFLTGLWSQGGLMGATAAEAFNVECGLGSTMTGEDILDGYLIVQVSVQMIRPAEFIELTLTQKVGVAR